MLDPLEAVALVARERREPLLARYRHRLRREELEDCYSQATLELLARARRRPGDGAGEPFAGSEHIANALEQRLCSRIQDRHRALRGRSPIEAAIAHAVPLAACGPREGDCRALIDRRADVERTALVREELRRIARFAHELTCDQRLLLASQLSLGQRPTEFCAQHGWSLEKYRKVGQRARARLSRLLACDDAGILKSTVPVTSPGRISGQGPAYEIHSPTT